MYNMTKQEVEDMNYQKLNEAIENDVQSQIDNDEAATSFAEYISELAKGNGDSRSVDMLWSVVEGAIQCKFQDRNTPINSLVVDALYWKAKNNVILNGG